MTQQVDLDALERLRSEATPGEWTADYEGGWIHVGKREVACVGDSDFPEHVDANAALIVAAVNALPELIAELRAARQTIAQLSGGQGPDDLSQCPFGHGEQCCGWHETCAAIAKGGP